jgi:hypothetical protein
MERTLYKDGKETVAKNAQETCQLVRGGWSFEKPKKKEKKIDESETKND